MGDENDRSTEIELEYEDKEVIEINDDEDELGEFEEMKSPSLLVQMMIFASQGNHRICCLPCGHLYGFSCIKEWLQTSSGPKCPQCNALCAYKDVILLYASRANAHQKISSTRHFPNTKQGLIEFEEHERLRCVDTMKMHAEERKRLFDVLEHQYDVANQMH